MGTRAPAQLEGTSDTVVVIGAEGRIVRVNTQAAELFGYSQEEWLGQKPDLLTARRPRRPDVKQRAGHVAQPRLRPLAHDLEMLARRRDGTESSPRISLSVLDDAETLVLTAIRDIESKRAEELYLTAIIQASEDAIIGKTLDGTIVSWNINQSKHNRRVHK